MPAPSVVAGWAVRYGPLVAPFIQKLYAQGRHRQLAILHARTLVDGAFSWEMAGGDRVWVVWTGDTVVATYPDVGTDERLFTGARGDRRQDPDDVLVRRVQRRVRAGVEELPRPVLPRRGGRSATDDGDPVAAPETDG